MQVVNPTRRIVSLRHEQVVGCYIGLWAEHCTKVIKNCSFDIHCFLETYGNDQKNPMDVKTIISCDLKNIIWTLNIVVFPTNPLYLRINIYTIYLYVKCYSVSFKIPKLLINTKYVKEQMFLFIKTKKFDLTIMKL